MQLPPLSAQLVVRPQQAAGPGWLAAAPCSRDVLAAMAAANASARGQRAAIMASPLQQLTGFYLTVDCRSAGCGGERSFAISEWAGFYKDRTVGEVLRQMRCSNGCGGRVLAARLETGPALNVRIRPRRVSLLGPEVRG